MAGKILLLGTKEEKKVSPIFWKSSVIRKVCKSPKLQKPKKI